MRCSTLILYFVAASVAYAMENSTHSDDGVAVAPDAAHGILAPSQRIVFFRAATHAFGGGISGALAMVIQIPLLMWLRTVMNYQYRHGLSFRAALSALLKDGGPLRLYQGWKLALLQGPLSRFGDTAANDGAVALLAGVDVTMPFVVTILASTLAALWRLLLHPVDTFKTSYQTDGSRAIELIWAKVQAHSVLTLWDGALGAAAASAVSHYPWFTTYNALRMYLPIFGTSTVAVSCRHAVIGFVSTMVADVCANGVRVVKTVVQTHPERLSYREAVMRIVNTDGCVGLWTRGLGARLCANALSGICFTVVWRALVARFVPKD